MDTDYELIRFEIISLLQKLAEKVCVEKLIANPGLEDLVTEATKQMMSEVEAGVEDTDVDLDMTLVNQGVLRLHTFMARKLEGTGSFELCTNETIGKLVLDAVENNPDDYNQVGVDLSLLPTAMALVEEIRGPSPFRQPDARAVALYVAVVEFGGVQELLQAT